MLGTPALARAAQAFSACGRAPGGPHRGLGPRVGRILAVIFAIYLVIMLAEHFTR